MNKIKLKSPFLRLACRLQILALSFVFLFFSCGTSQKENSGKESLKVVNWNLQTFFDASFDGNEYSEYRNEKSGWSKERYEERLDRLASVIKELDADLFVMEELEKEEQIQDIANRLSGTFDFAKLYTHGFFAKTEGSSIGCAILSRYSLEGISVHTIDFRNGKKQPSMRPIIQFSLTKNKSKLTLFVNHWKSKSGGAEESEIWRKRQEKLLVRLMQKVKGKDKAVLALGDFNKDIWEFDISESDAQDSQNGERKTNIMLHGEEKFAVYSPWILEDGNCVTQGSYWYKNFWERIDHFFAAGNIRLTDFKAECSGEWAYEDGHPKRYQLWNGKGYSDHLPISCTVIF
ncbi:endonuclease/exonuclease/phosphatase family protein [Treponema sp. UBA3813]|uniref:endonuclease/exonuclease/phosphatase family protein n=1 Tax=Treponema sp. UBA3813 TaxID=1947715 RepID=UPI0025FD3D9B|nr:endonuclease/exonuclease/phosphatase family protein [Treponema sp. UBA3813]